MTGSNCVHRPSDDIDDVTLGSDSDYVTARSHVVQIILFRARCCSANAMQCHASIRSCAVCTVQCV
jgi:hypothetical protein